MGGHPVPEIRCQLGSKPIDLNTDLSDDENGKGVHEECYVGRISASHPHCRCSCKLVISMNGVL